MSQDGSGTGVRPGSRGEQVVGAGLVEGVDVTHEEIANIGSPSIRPSHLRAVLERARAAVADGLDGVVLTHGTDTLEETAFLLNRLWDRAAPLVVTGAMHPADAPGADGPANVRDAIRAAASSTLRELGVLAVLDGTAHLADRVTKVSSRRTSAFASSPDGALAVVDGADVRLLQRLVDPRPAHLALDLPDPLPTVPVIGLGIGDDGAVLDSLPEGSLAGLVVSGVGMGHVPEPVVPRLRRLVDAGVPVVVSTRIPEGGTSTHHYAYPGSEVDLLANGCLMAGVLPAHKARLLLQLLLADGARAGDDRLPAAFGPFAS
ncbi:asparaginase [Brachybacterium endophyticum]|uniref:Asparaginase n=2 Tax=Brachybacterium endophyticum TaxID=2182385 RepID=A0A2U2RPU1_9MICO|nr:asparaginase [Brachybacterium endophyticum]